MQKLALLLLLLLLSSSLFAQIDTFSLLQINQNRLELNRIHAYVLGGWAITNLTVGGYLTYVLYDGEPESFHHMNASWGLINLGVAWFMLHNISHTEPGTYDLEMTIQNQYQTQKLMMLNLGLDLSYTLAGVALREHGKNSAKYAYMFKGFGNSLILQGLFLLALDTTFYTLYTGQNEDLLRMLRHVSVNENGIGLILRL